MSSEPLYPLLGIARLRMGIDGAGVTTLVAGAGCPLRCRWCINKRVLAEGKSEQVTAEELYRRVKVDDLYFRATGGGVTFGGGESLLHVPFLKRFRALAPDWHLTAETGLAVPSETVKEAAECFDFFLVDCKDMNGDIYRSYTGGDVRLMENNLRFLLGLVGPGRIRVRVPLIPEYNTEKDRENSVSRLRELGVLDLDCFEYVIRDSMD